MALGSEYTNEEIINELIELEVIKDKDALQKLLIGQPEKVPERKEENKPGSGATLLVQPFSGKDGSISGSSQSSLHDDGLGNPSTKLMPERVASYRGKEGGKT